MSYEKAKVYSDGSHYIGIPHEEHPERGRKPFGEKQECSNKSQKNEPKPKSNKEVFEELYSASKNNRFKDKQKELTDLMQSRFYSAAETEIFVAENLERKKRNLIAKQVRLYRKVYLQEWTFFATFTYDSKKHCEESFRKSLRNCLSHFANRKGWKYIGVWERSPEKERLHFHALLFVPECSMPGKLVEKNDYDTTEHKRQITYQNTFFNERFGRTDFKPLCKTLLPEAVGYLTKYLIKTNERLIYSRNLPTYFVSDVLEDEVICRTGIDDRKLILADNFTCIDDGEVIGTVSNEVIEKMPKAN